MRLAILVSSALVFILLQALALDKLAIGEISPDFPLLLCAFLALYKGPIRGSIIGFVIGLLQDLFNPDFLGLNALTKSIVGYAFGQLGTKAVPERSLFLAAFLFLAALGHDLIYLLFFTALDIGKFVVLFFTVAVPSAVYTTIFGVVVHRVILFAGSWMVRSLGKTR
jgi:rod shape-determining protein MreD